jgi:hypothetical protein
VLIERARSVVTDSQGAYKIVDLRPGTYVVSFTLTGFSTVKREGIELTGTFTAIVNADLRVGAVSETITVSGTLYGDRINQIDFRAGKVVQLGRLRTQFSVDLYNALNSSAIQTYNQTFIVDGAWLTPTLVLPARFAKLTAQVDF